MTGELMEAVDVLRDQREHRAAALELDQRAMAGVRRGAPGRMLETALPGEPPHFGIRHVVLDVRKLLGFRILGPDTLRPAEVGNSGLGGNPGAGERDHTCRGGEPTADLVDERLITPLYAPAELYCAQQV